MHFFVTSVKKKTQTTKMFKICRLLNSYTSSNFFNVIINVLIFKVHWFGIVS